MKVDLLGIDLQRDFTNNGGALYVPGGEEDCKNVANFIDKFGDRLNDIHMTLDTHGFIDIAHPIWWRNTKGEMPSPYTVITVEDFESGKWQCRFPHTAEKTRDYLQKLRDNNRYSLVVWPPHCIKGSMGASFNEDVEKALLNWCEKNAADYDAVVKGTNPFTEHYSAVKADVFMADDPEGTGLNTSLIDTLANVDKIIIVGEALNYCVANTVRDIANEFGDENVKKMVLFEDGTSEISVAHDLTVSFLDEMKARGMQVMKSTEFFAGGM